MSADEVFAERFRNEAQFTDWCIGVFRENGWLITHMRDSRKQHPNTHTGTPDLKGVHPVRIRMFEAELKMKGKYPRPDQRSWLDALRFAAERSTLFDVFLWYPKDWREIRAFAEGRL